MRGKKVSLSSQNMTCILKKNGDEDHMASDRMFQDECSLVTKDLDVDLTGVFPEDDKPKSISKLVEE